MKRCLLTMVLLSSALTMPARSAAACTTFLLRHGGLMGGAKYFVGKSYDWKEGMGHVVFNKRGVGKRALVLDTRQTPATWESKHASLTFNQYGREMPNGGMNDAGLVVEIMWLIGSTFPAPDDRPTVNELQWIQYQLDNFSTVAEAVAAVKAVRPHRVYAEVHYLMCDRSGACAALELLDGRFTVTTGPALQTPTLTNDTYAESLSALRKKRAKKIRSVPRGKGSLARFIRAATLAGQAGGGADPVTETFRILDSVRNGNYSKWQIVYDLDALRVHWRSLGAWETKTVALADTPATCDAPVTWLDLNHQAAGPALAAFAPWTANANLDLLKRSMKRIAGDLPAGTIEQLAKYPAQLQCSIPASPTTK